MTSLNTHPVGGLFRATSFVALAIGLLAAGPALAQTAAADAQPANDIVVTGRFLDTGASSATKLDIPVLDTPFSVASYNNNFMKAIETNNISDLYKYMNGIQRAGNTGYDITFRGFKTSGNDRNAILTDGLPGLSVRFGSPPTIGVDHVELVKGPTSVLYGQAQPGGFINIITKKPKSSPEFSIGLRGESSASSYGRQLGGLISMDLTGPVTEDGSLSARFVGEGGYTRGFRDYAYEKPIYVSPSLTWDLGSRTSVTIQGEYRWVKSHYDTYLAAYNRDVNNIADITTTYQEPDDYLIERGATANIYVSHEFSNDVKLNVGYRYVDHYDTQRNYDVVGFRNATTITRRARGQLNLRTYSFVDANVTAKVDTFGIQHSLLVGFNGGQETASLRRLQFYNCTGSCTALDVNVYNPVHGVLPLPTAYPIGSLSWRVTSQNSIGLYASDFIEFSDMFKAMVGIRYADERQDIDDLETPNFVYQKKKDTKFLPLAGLLFQPIKQVSFYASYSTSFVPVAATAQDINGNNPFAPTEANSIEGGVKAELFDRRLNVTTAYFDIKKKNTLNTFSCAIGNCSNQLGGERSRGFEIEATATPLPNWQITGGYSHTIARVTNSNVPGQTGARLANAPINAFNFWSRYDITDGALKDLGIGLGVSFIGKRHGLLPTQAVDSRPDNGTLPLPRYTTVDLGLYYKLGDNIDLTLKAQNLFEERYIESAGFSGDIQLVPGTPRTLTLTARSHF